MANSSIYTKKGDQGETCLVGGTKVLKSSSQVDLYGNVDELNSFVGLVLSYLDKKDFEKIRINLTWLQSKLFDLGAFLACEEEKREKYNITGIKVSDIEKIEKEIDSLDEQLEPLKLFILPQGEKVIAYLHICRSITRRVERKLVEVEKGNALIFLNRLSDYFFIIARYMHYKLGIKEIYWRSS